MAGGLEAILDGLTITKYDDWLIFVQRLEGLVQSGRARRIPPPPTTGRMWGGREWFLDTESGEVYLYGTPDSPTLPSWEKVDFFSTEKPARSGRTGMFAGPTGMAEIPMGEMSGREAASLKLFLQILVCHGMAEFIDRPLVIEPATPAVTETWYQDLRTKAVYKLVENMDEDSGRWERASLSQATKTIQ
jgi:hypothetical protein